MAVRVVVVVLVALAMLVPTRSDAEVAGTGSFGVFVSPPPPVPTFDGDITFDSGMNVVLGQAVNLALDVGPMTFDGEVIVNAGEGSATFTLGADADEADFSFVAGGSASCAAAGCAIGAATFAGTLEVEFDDANALPDGVFTFDGTVQLDALGEGLGTFAINAFPPVATAAGSGVEVTSGVEAFFDSVAGAERSFEARATFADVATAGTTSFAALSVVSGALPAGIALVPGVSVFVDVRTSASLGGDVELCLAFPDADGDGVVDGAAIPAADLRLLHATTVGAAFADVTTAPGIGIVCGSAPAPGPIVLGVAQDGVGTTTTTLPSGETTTTSSTLGGGDTTTTSTLGGGESTTTTVVTPGSTTTSCSPSAATTTSLTIVVTTTTQPLRVPVTTTIVVRASTTSSTAPVCATALDCIEVTLAGPLCPGEALNPRLATLIMKKLAKAERMLLEVVEGGGGKRAEKLVAKARKQMDKIGRKADAFVARKRRSISSACRDQIRAAVARVTQQIEARRF